MALNVPVELVDDILNEACRALDASDISSIALTSHTFRIRANMARFSTFTTEHIIHDMDRTVRRIRTLAEVMKCGEISKNMPGVGTFIRSFSLVMRGNFDCIMAVLDDVSIVAYILDNLFRPCPTYIPFSSWTTRSLHLNILAVRRAGASYYSGFSWKYINSGLSQALQNLLRFSQLDELSLTGMRDIPHDLLLGSHVKHLRLRGVFIDRSSQVYSQHSRTSPSEEPVLLRSIDVDSYFPYSEIEMLARLNSCQIPLSPTYILSHLTNFAMDLVLCANFETLNGVLHHAPYLRSLAARLYIKETDYVSNKNSCKIHYHFLTQLVDISFLGMGNTYRLISQLLLHDPPPNLHAIQITSAIPRYSTPAEITASLQHGDIGILDQTLTHPSFDSLQRVIISLIIDVHDSLKLPHYLKQWNADVSNRFPLLWEVKNDLKVDIEVRWKHEPVRVQGAHWGRFVGTSGSSLGHSI